MKTLNSRFRDHYFFKIILAAVIIIILITYFTVRSIAAERPVNDNKVGYQAPNDSVAIAAVLKSYHQDLYYPLSVERFYKSGHYQLVWMAPDTVKTHAAEAMLLLDCVLHYGLSPNDYHPKELLYDELNRITSNWDKTSSQDKAKFDILLTDAMFNLMNNMHYGKLNPLFPPSKIDAGGAITFNAEAKLMQGLPVKQFMSVIESAQPASKEYADMQDHMRLLTGQYQEDCYEVPQEDIRIMAINLERIRWINSAEKTYVEINIPAFSLTFHQPDTSYIFKTIVGTPANPTPALASAIDYFTTAPDWKVPHSIFVKETLPRALKDTAYLENNHFAIYDLKGNFIEPTKTNLIQVRKHTVNYYARQSSGCDNALGLIVFRFSNTYDIYLHDTPEQLLFGKEERAFSHGCIRVEHAEKLAGLLLKNDGSAGKLSLLRKDLANYQTMNFRLKTPVPIIINYLTCVVKEGELIKYKDIYDLDKRLESALYQADLPITMR